MQNIELDVHTKRLIRFLKEFDIYKRYIKMADCGDKASENMLKLALKGTFATPSLLGLTAASFAYNIEQEKIISSKIFELSDEVSNRIKEKYGSGIFHWLFAYLMFSKCVERKEETYYNAFRSSFVNYNRAIQRFLIERDYHEFEKSDTFQGMLEYYVSRQNKKV